MKNGYAEAWTQGLRGVTVRPGIYTGHLVGFTEEKEVVIGNAVLTVDPSTVSGTLSFTNLEHWNTSETLGEIGTGTQWRDGRLSYPVSVRDDYSSVFVQTGGDGGIVTGMLLRASVSETGLTMVGVLERDGLTAAFGGKWSSTD